MVRRLVEIGPRNFRWQEVEEAAPAYPPIVTRNLCFHIAPFIGGNGAGVWRWALRQLARRIGLFNGRRLIAVATGHRLETMEVVRSECFALGINDGEYIDVPNVPQLREVASFLPLFTAIAELGAEDPAAATLYAQAKGVTRGPDHPAHLWTEMLYETCLDYWPHVDRLLGRFPVAGPFRKLGLAWPKDSESTWHFSGSWFWFRNQALFSKPDWQRIDQFWSGIEPYPSLHFTAEEAGGIFLDGVMPTMQFYPTQERHPNGWEYIRQVAYPALMRWRIEHLADYREWTP
jgi:hypothetical protein